ncbi:hypothetical protein GCM10027068_39920 [Prescottella soli]
MDGGLASPEDGECAAGARPDACGSGDAFAALSDAGFTGVDREGIGVRVLKHDASAPGFDPI